jgi:hypothetical protein
METFSLEIGLTILLCREAIFFKAVKHIKVQLKMVNTAEVYIDMLIEMFIKDFGKMI